MYEHSPGDSCMPSNFGCETPRFGAALPRIFLYLYIVTRANDAAFRALLVRARNAIEEAENMFLVKCPLN